jgi:hypothetical protein
MIQAGSANVVSSTRPMQPTAFGGGGLYAAIDDAIVYGVATSDLSAPRDKCEALPRRVGGAEWRKGLSCLSVSIQGPIPILATPRHTAADLPLVG